MNDNKTGGTADLLVRSDYINKIFRRRVVSEEMENVKAPNLNGNYHYRVIDIKWTTMTLCANGYNIRNDGRFPAYKGQLAIYNCALGFVQGYTPNEAYIMAKAWKRDSKVNPEQGHSCFDLLGVIDYSSFDNPYITKTAESIKWVRDVREHGDSWDLLNPVREEMYPNACNTFDAPWTKQKKKLCKDLDEITQIWYVTDNHRRNAHKNGVKSWRDPNCTSETMEITGEIKPEVIDMILDINRDPEATILPQEIENNFMNWQETGPCDFFVDFETINCCFYNPEIDIENSKNESDIIFMIGVGYVEDDEWHYDVFTADDVSFAEEKKIIDRFTEFIDRKSLEYDHTGEYMPRLFHWSMAEVNNFRHANNRHREKWVEWQKNIVWVDMYNVFTTEPIVVKGALNFKLKEIGGSLHRLGLIDTMWKETGPSDGFTAMLEAVEYYKEKSNGNL
ncbi:MAG: hypothetical protein EBQ92_00115, partial [Proteobacteria bacterium]|nr:hypothetical protein [Pseudomonadota bacterium]